LESCSSNYVVILDADDVSSKFRLEIQYQYMEDHPETALLAANCVVDDKDILKAPAKEINVQPICKTALIKRNPICHSSVIIRSSVFRELGGYNTTRDVLFDYDLWIRMASANHFFSAVNLPLVFKRIHSGQNFERKRRVYYLWEATKLKLKAKKYFSNNTFDYFYIMGAFVYGLMPLFLRKKLMGKI